MRILLWVLVLFMVASTDPISYPWNPSNSDSLTVARYKADRKENQRVINGNLSNINIADTANIAQSKIDSSTGWISNVTGLFTNNSPFWELHSPYGLKFFINDSTANDKEMLFVSDSVDSIMKLDNDSAIIYKPTRFASTVTVDNIGVDSLSPKILQVDSVFALTTDTVYVDASTLVDLKIPYTNTLIGFRYSGGAGVNEVDSITGGNNGDILYLYDVADAGRAMFTEEGNIRVSDRDTLGISGSYQPLVPLIKNGDLWYRIN